MLLENKAAVIYGGGGAVGSAVAKAFAREGARVFIAGRTLANARSAADAIIASGGAAEAAQLDALDERAVELHADAVLARAGAIDIAFNAIGLEDVQGTPLARMSLADFEKPIVKAMRVQFLTARAVARRMVPKRAGVIMTIIAGPAEAIPYIGGFGSACEATQGLWRGLAAELGPSGVRLIGLRSAGSPDTPDVQETMRLHAQAGGVTLDECLAYFGNESLLKRLPLVAEVANVAALLASDRASAMTGTFVNVTCGSRAD